MVAAPRPTTRLGCENEDKRAEFRMGGKEVKEARRRLLWLCLVEALCGVI